jgi:hypothetical protein
MPNDKIRQGFLWKGRKEVNGGSCLVSWEVVTRPLSYGGLGVPNLKFKSWALQAKWLWLEKTDPSRPWHGLSLPVQRQVRQFFELSVFTVLGNGANTLFWSDRWVYGSTIQDIASEVVRMVGRGAFSSRTVARALDNWQWVSDINGPLSLRGLQQYLLLWDTLRGVMLSQDTNKHVRMHTFSRQFSSKSCYKHFSWDPFPLSHGNDCGRLRLPQNASFFSGWQ